MGKKTGRAELREATYWCFIRKKEEHARPSRDHCATIGPMVARQAPQRHHQAAKRTWPTQAEKGR
jgi:hypothetical protein